jgi:sugar transferase (PEP-CTERM/EpsH1 system associated)
MKKPQKIRILHVLHAFSPGGIENGIVNIINRSPDHLIHELCLLSKSGEFINRVTRPVVVHEMNKKSGNGLRVVFQLQHLFRKLKVDVIHTRNWAAFDAVVAACLMRKPALIHGEHGRDISDPNGEIFRRNLARRMLAFRARKFVAVSRDLYTWLKQTVHIPIRKLAFIPNGVDTDRFSPGCDFEMRRELGIAKTEFVVGTVGRLDPVKNHHGLIRAVKRLHDTGYPVRLVIVGDGPLCDAIQRYAEILQTPKPLLLGFRDHVERLYRTFDLFVLNSIAEGMSNTLLEAMASGLPIVCTSVGGNVELVANDHTGLLVRSGDDVALVEAMLKNLSTSSDRSVMAANARRFAVNNFSIKRMVEQYTTLYESVA